MDIDFEDVEIDRAANSATCVAIVNSRRIVVTMPLDSIEHLYEDWEPLAAAKIQRVMAAARHWPTTWPAQVALGVDDFCAQ